LTNAWVNFAAVEASRISQPSARFMPAPAAAPFTAAMTGWGASRIASRTRSRRGATLSISGRSARPSLTSFMAFTSPPEQNPLPAPVTTITRMAASWLARSTAA
jgi:hypothetical protein